MSLTEIGPQTCPKCNAVNVEEASKVCSPMEGQCPIVEAGFWRGWPTIRQWADKMRAEAIQALVECGPVQDMPTEDDIKHSLFAVGDLVTTSFGMTGEIIKQNVSPWEGANYLIYHDEYLPIAGKPNPKRASWVHESHLKLVQKTDSPK